MKYFLCGSACFLAMIIYGFAEKVFADFGFEISEGTLVIYHLLFLTMLKNFEDTDNDE